MAGKARTTVGALLIGAGSLLISAGEVIGRRRWKLHPAERSNGQIDLELNVGTDRRR